MTHSNPKEILLSVLMIAGTFLSLLSVLYLLTDYYAVNVLYWDQWDIAGPIFRAEGWLAEFRYQHGPHRLGLGGLFTHAVYALTAWNVKSESFATLGVVALATVLALVLYFRLTRVSSPYAAIIPASMLSLTTFEIYTSAPNPSHGAVPLLLGILLCFVIVAADSWIRSILLVGITTAVVHTGFGILYGPLMVALTLAGLILGPPFLNLHSSLWRWLISRRVLTFLALCLGVGSFFIGYIKNSASGCAPEIVPSTEEYLRFAALLITKSFGNTQNEAPGVFYVALPILVIWFSCFGVAVRSAWIEVRTGKLGIGSVSALLIAYSIVFVAMSAIGRTCAGVHYGGSSRYQIHLAPAYLGICLILGIAPRFLSVRLLQLVLFGGLLWGSIRALQTDEFGLRAPRTVRLEGRDCLLKHRNLDYCFSHIPNFLYPVPHQVQMAERLKWLEANKFNLYAEE